MTIKEKLDLSEKMRVAWADMRINMDGYIDFRGNSVLLDGHFSPDQLKAIAYIMANNPTWFNEKDYEGYEQSPGGQINSGGSQK
jgi:hypothetical protein